MLMFIYVYDVIVVTACKLGKLWDSLSELRSCL